MRIAICQLLIEGGEPFRNFERCEKMLHEARENNYELALYPETMDLHGHILQDLRKRIQFPDTFPINYVFYQKNIKCLYVPV